MTVSFFIQRHGRSVTITLDGELVVQNRHVLKAKVVEELETGARHFTLRFERCGYIDSSGLGILVGIRKKVREAGGSVTLAALNRDLHTLFDYTKLSPLFTLVDCEPSEYRYPVVARTETVS